MLRVMAVSAPHWVSDGGSVCVESLDSSVPFSLLNAIRMAAGNAEAGVGIWKDSNWRDKEMRNRSIQLMSYLERDKNGFIERIREIRPNLLLIGSMTLAFPGAVAIAKIAKEILGDEVFVVLGGKHTLETIYEKKGRIEHHAGSPLKLMAENKIPKVFDLVVAGDGEEIVVEIGEILGRMHKQSLNIRKFGEFWDQLLIADGRWIAGRLEEGKIQCIQSIGTPIDYSQIPSTSDLFATASSFNVFEKCETVHSYSYGSKGCVHNCAFCSERISVNGKPSCPKATPFNLLKDFTCVARRFGRPDWKNPASLFIEDSILLGGDEDNIEMFCKLLDLHKPNLRFGCQLTIDKILRTSMQNLLSKLTKHGLEYIFWGIETANDQIAAELSKNIHGNNWLAKNEKAIQWVAEHDLKCGVSLMFGLGETQADRVLLLRHLIKMTRQYGKPNSISMNIATQHPLQGHDGDANYDYIEWGTSADSSYLPLFIELFGEASVRYQMPTKKIPSIDNLLEIRKLYREAKYIQNVAKQVKSKNCHLAPTHKLQQKINRKLYETESRI